MLSAIERISYTESIEHTGNEAQLGETKYFGGPGYVRASEEGREEAVTVVIVLHARTVFFLELGINKCIFGPHNSSTGSVSFPSIFGTVSKPEELPS